MPLAANDQGRLWSSKLEAWIGAWEGRYLQTEGVWLRLFDRDGQLLPTAAEAAIQRAEMERQRAEAIEAELARLQAELNRLKGGE